jgi:hypothetical protein
MSVSVGSHESGPQVVTLPVDQLRKDGGTQPRVTINWETAYEYGDEMKAGPSFPQSSPSTMARTIG